MASSRKSPKPPIEKFLLMDSLAEPKSPTWMEPVASTLSRSSLPNSRRPKLSGRECGPENWNLGAAHSHHSSLTPRRGVINTLATLPVDQLGFRAETYLNPLCKYWIPIHSKPRTLPARAPDQ